MTGPSLKELLDDITDREIRTAEEAERDTRRDLIRTALLCVAWSAIGVYLILWSAHTTNVFYGKVSFFSGLAIGNGGMIYTLLRAYLRGERRGDW